MIKVLRSSQDMVVVAAQFSATTPQVLYQHFTDADLLARWWPPSVPHLDPQVGGSYHFAWPAMDWDLRGTYTVIEAGQVLAFTWLWEHEPNLPMRDVFVVFGHTDTGAALTLRHGTYTNNSQDQADRQSHIDGWKHFLSRLATVVLSAT